LLVVEARAIGSLADRRERNLEKQEKTEANKGRKNHSPKPYILGSPDKLATRLRGFPKAPSSATLTYNFVIDNKPFRRRMWEKVAVSGQASRGRGQKQKTSRRQWN
jgi:hypothetical protein